MILLKSCPACESSILSHKLTCNDHTTSKENFNIVSCETCSFTFTNPSPSQESLKNYYKSGMYISHTNSSKGLFNWTYQTIRRYTIKNKLSLLRSIKQRGTHLDVGCGTGEFLNACKNAGFKTFGIEPSKLAREQAVKLYNLSVNEKTDLSLYEKGKFDSISMWHALEHIPELNKTISSLNRILKPNGKIIVAVPNHKSWDAEYYKEYWAGWDVPIHLWHFSKKTITSLFEKHKFQLITTKPMIFDSYYVSLLSEEFISGKKKFIKSFFIGLASNLAGVFTKRGHSSTIYIFEKPQQK